MTVRLRLAGGMVASDWVHFRVDRRGDFHAIVEPEHWRGKVDVTDIVIDVNMEQVMMEFEEVIQRLIDRRHPGLREDENAEMHDAADRWFREQEKSKTKPQTATSGEKDTEPDTRPRSEKPYARTRGGSGRTSTRS